MSSTSKTSTVSIEDLHKRLYADFSSGKLYYKPTGLSWWDTRYANKECFNLDVHGYLGGTINRIRLLKHRVLFAMYYGRWPEQIDHIDRDKKNNKISNLRESNPLDNQRNVGIRRHNTSGKTGVHYKKREKLWLAFIAGDTLGYFKTKKEAVEARLLAEKGRGFVGD